MQHFHVRKGFPYFRKGLKLRLDSVGNLGTDASVQRSALGWELRQDGVEGLSCIFLPKSRCVSLGLPEEGAP